MGNCGVDRAISPTVGVILLVAVTVVLSATVGIFVFNLGGTTGSSAQAGVTTAPSPTGGTTLQVTDIGTAERVLVELTNESTVSLTVGEQFTVPPCERATVLASADGKRTHLRDIHENTHIVSQSGGDDFTSIEAAVNASQTGDRVCVRSGTYEELVDINKSITVMTVEGAVMDGSSFAMQTSASTGYKNYSAPFHIDSGAAPEIRGFRIQSYTLAIDAFQTTNDWTVSNLSVDGTTTGVYARKATGDWTVSNSWINGTSYNGIQAQRTTGAWVVRDTVTTNHSYDGIHVEHAEADWTVTNLTSRRNGAHGIHAHDTKGEWLVQNSTLKNNSNDGVDAHASSGAWRISHSTIVANGVGVDAGNAAVRGDASVNWWGQSTGPTSGQYSGNVTVTPYCTDADCTTTSG